MMPDRPEARISLEDLLRLKRAERPAPEFWTRFEQELRVKQLAAIVEKKPWWQFNGGFPKVLGRFSRLPVPLGATAVLALTFVIVRESQTVSSLRSPQTVDTMVSALPGSVSDPYADHFVRGSTDSASAQSAPVVSPDVAELSEVRVDAGSPAVAEGQSVRATHPWMGDSVAVSGLDANELSPSARSIAANLAAAQDADPALAQVLDARLGFDARASSPTTEPLSQVTSPTESRRARLAAYVTAASLSYGDGSASADRVRGRISNRINERELYDGVTRLGVGGDRLTLKF